MSLTIEQLREILVGQAVWFKMDVRGPNNPEPLILPGTIIDVRRQCGRVDVRVKLLPPARGQVWTKREAVTLVEKEPVDTLPTQV